MAAANTRAMMPATIQNPCLELPVAAPALLTFYTAGANGALIEEINISNQDGSNARSVELWINNGTSDFLLGSAEVPLNSGQSDVASFKLLTNLGMAPLALEATYILKIKAVATLTSVMHCVATPALDYVAL